jgi:hypothetical protein
MTLLFCFCCCLRNPQADWLGKFVTSELAEVWFYCAIADHAEDAPGPKNTTFHRPVLVGCIRPFTPVPRRSPEKLTGKSTEFCGVG